MTKAICQQCRKEYEVKYPFQKYCSNKCVIEHNRKFDKALFDKTCEKCGKKFVSTTVSARYCSRECAGNTKKPVQKLDIYLNVVEEYESIGQAARENYLTSKQIAYACKRYGKCVGYYWRFKQ